MDVIRNKECKFCERVTPHEIDEEGILLDECLICGELSERKFT